MGKETIPSPFFYFKNYLSNKISMQITSATYFIQQGDPSEQHENHFLLQESNNSHFMSDIFSHTRCLSIRVYEMTNYPNKYIKNL